MNEILKVIVGLLSSGALGYINYTMLVDNGLVSSFEDINDKRATIIIYSIIDLAIYLLVTSVISIFIELPFVSISISILLTMFVVYLSMKYVSPKLYKLVLTKTNKSRNDKSLTSQSIYSPREKAFEQDNYMKVYIYDFSGNLINYGWLKGISENLELDHEILLRPNGEKESVSEEEIQDILNTQTYDPDDNVIDTNIYIDMKNKIKYYIIYYSLEEE